MNKPTSWSVRLVQICAVLFIIGTVLVFWNIHEPSESFNLCYVPWPFGRIWFTTLILLVASLANLGIRSDT